MRHMRPFAAAKRAYAGMYAIVLCCGNQLDGADEGGTVKTGAVFADFIVLLRRG